MATADRPRSRWHRLLRRMRLLLVAIALLWAIELWDQTTGGRLDAHGIRPGTSEGLRNILYAPLLHGNFRHLWANTGALAVLGACLLLNGLWEAAWVTALVWIGSGLGVWLLADPNTVHVGASGVVFGYLGFLLARGIYARHLGDLVLAVGVASLYGTALWGLLPADRHVSWQGHLGGFVSGIVAAWSAARLRRRPGP